MTARSTPSLLGVTANATGTVVRFAEPKSKHGLQVILTGAPSGGTITLLGSIDGDDFVSLGAVFTIGTDASGVIKFATDKPVLALRADLAGLAGGTAPTVTAYVTAAP